MSPKYIIIMSYIHNTYSIALKPTVQRRLYDRSHLQGLIWKVSTFYLSVSLHLSLPHLIFTQLFQRLANRSTIEPGTAWYFIGIYWFSSTLYGYWISIPEEDIVRSIGTYYLLLFSLILTIISVNTAYSPVSTDTALNINTNITFIPAYCPLCKYISRVLDHAWLGMELQNKSQLVYILHNIIGKS